MGLLLKLNLSPLLWPIIKALLWAVLRGPLYVLHLESQNGAYKFFYILKMY